MRWMTATGLAFAVALAAAPTEAANTLIRIDDRTDTVNFLVNGVSQGTTAEAVGGFSGTVAGSGFTGVNVGFQIMEPGQSAISDLMTLLVEVDTTAGTTAVDITFVSDTNGVALTVPTDFFLTTGAPEIIPEFGTFQTVYSDTLSADFSLTIQFASDVSDVPEPGTLGLLAAGLLGLGAIRLRRKTRSLTI